MMRTSTKSTDIPALLTDAELESMAHYRLRRVRAEMARLNIGACVLSDPVSIRYATGTRNMQIFTARNAPSRYLLLTANQAILHEFTGCMHLARGHSTLTEVRPARCASFVAAGERIAEQEASWAADIAASIRELVGSGVRVGMERMNAGAALALAECGFEVVDAQQAVELARAIKSPAEVICIKTALRSTERAVAHMVEALRPGISENELWSRLHQRVIADGADYCETRLLASGTRTNPWFQETGNKLIGADELVAFDTDVVGIFGYYCDFSRTFHAGPGNPSRGQRQLYRLAWEQLQHNIAVLKPGLSFREYAERAWDIPEQFLSNRYYLSAHGCGMTGEYPYLYHRRDFPACGYDGVVQAGMTICVESYMGEEGGGEGVKLEQQCLVTSTGVEVLSHYPFEADLLTETR